jgi:uncharacterized DUF497 family protein
VIDFAFDPVKSDANQRKHGIDVLAAKALWRDPALLEIPARTTGEPRFLVIALLRGRHWSAVITYRGPAIGLISGRRSRKDGTEPLNFIVHPYRSCGDSGRMARLNSSNRWAANDPESQASGLCSTVR